MVANGPDKTACNIIEYETICLDNRSVYKTVNNKHILLTLEILFFPYFSCLTDLI